MRSLIVRHTLWMNRRNAIKAVQSAEIFAHRLDGGTCQEMIELMHDSMKSIQECVAYLERKNLGKIAINVNPKYEREKEIIDFILLFYKTYGYNGFDAVNKAKAMQEEAKEKHLESLMK